MTDYDEIKYEVARANARARIAATPVIMSTLAANLPQVKLPFNLFEVGTLWKEDEEGPFLWLVPQSHFDQVPDGAAMVSITGDVKIKGVHDIDQDTRGGFLAFGFFGPQLAH